MKGTLEGTEIIFQEYETQSTDVVVPVNYVGKLDVSKLKLSGTFKGAENAAGNFELDFSKPSV